MAKKNKCRLRIKGKKLSAFFDRELPEYEILEIEKKLRESRPDHVDSSNCADALSGDRRVIDEWRDLRIALRNWHQEEMRDHDRDLLQDRLWGSISDRLISELKQQDKESVFTRMFRSWWHTICSCLSINRIAGQSNWFARSTLVTGCVVIVLLFIVAPQVDRTVIHEQQIATSKEYLKPSLSTDKAFFHPTDEPAIERQYAYNKSKSSLEPQQLARREVEAAPPLVFSSRGVVQPSSRLSAPSIPQRQMMGTSVAELTTVGELNGGSFESEGGGNFTNRMLDENIVKGGKPTMAVDGLDWDWVRSRGPIVIMRSDNSDEASMVWVTASR